MVKVLFGLESSLAYASMRNLHVGAAKPPAGHELRQAQSSKERARFVKCVGCVISPLYIRAVILYLFLGYGQH